MLALRGRGRFTGTDVADVTQLALAGLIQHVPDTAGPTVRVSRHGSEMLVLDLPIVFPAGVAGKMLCKKCLILLVLVKGSRAVFAVPPIAAIDSPDAMLANLNWLGRALSLAGRYAPRHSTAP